ncbi:MAG: hypothetical protein KQH57_20180 [Actinomycetales bacterium]|nr:hypothetical protein [Actinomycetales bacterium]
MVLIDIDEYGTWPAGLERTVRSIAERYEGAGSTSSDLWLGDDERTKIEFALDGVSVRVFHATRLLPFEVTGIRREGLKLASGEMFASKVSDAVACGVLSHDEGEELIRSAMPLDGSAGARAAQVCASAGTAVYRDDPHGVRPLLESWGGEVLYFAHEHDALGKRLRHLGTPTVIELSVPAVRPHDLWFPGVEQCVVGAVLGFADVGADVFIRADAVAPREVLAVHQPGGAWWARFPRLPD